MNHSVASRLHIVNAIFVALWMKPNRDMEEPHDFPPPTPSASGGITYQLVPSAAGGLQIRDSGDSAGYDIRNS
ncbi:MAG: hypothetical protein Q8O04_12495 [Deltaproteobacteria bacterium]|nr:hypothetical protein [Deltaproteobacteria bacterium]